MTIEQARQVLLYMGEMKAMRKEIRRERAEIEVEYCGLKSPKMDGMPHRSSPESAVALAAERMDAEGDGDRLRALAERERLLQEDEMLIRGVLDRMRAVYKTLLLETYVDKHSWEKVSRRVRYSLTSCKRLRNDALARFAEIAQTVPGIDGVEARARDARG